MYAGVDPSITNTGVVVLNATGQVLGCFNSKHRTGKAKASTPYQRVFRYGEIAAFATNCIHSCAGKGPCIVGYEDYSFDSENKAFTIGELGGVLKLELVTRVGDLLLAAPQRVKSFATGHGTAGKEKMVKQATSESSYISQLTKKDRTDDVCDAYFLAKIAWYTADPKQAAEHDTDRGLVRHRLSIAKQMTKELNNGERNHLSTLPAWQRRIASGHSNGKQQRGTSP